MNNKSKQQDKLSPYKKQSKMISFYRWLDILLLSVFVLVIISFFKTPIIELLYKWTSYISRFNNITLIAAILLVVAFTTVVLIRLGAIGSLKKILQYPPAWASSIVVIIIAVGYYFCTNPVSVIRGFNFELFLEFLFIAIGVAIGFLYNHLENKLSSGTEVNSIPVGIDQNGLNIKEDFLKWFSEERPITSPKDDLLDNAIVAERIAKQLILKPPSSIGVVGPYGSGKSSIICLVENYIKDPKFKESIDKASIFDGKIILRRINSWGHSSGKIAQIMLSIAIEEVKKYVDCSSVITLPQNYVNTIANAKYIKGSFISALFSTIQDPVPQLCRLDNILIAANLRLILVLEDLDRNANDANIKEEIPALLDRIRHLRNVSFLIAIGTGWEFSDIIKRICIHEEDISGIQQSEIYKIFTTFRNNCLEAYPGDIDVLSNEKRDERMGIISDFANINSSFLYVTKRRTQTIYDICNLVKTPRLLKHIIRRTNLIWEKLHGEIDFDDILVANTLRFGAPIAFEFLLAHYKDINDGESHKKEDIDSIEEKWAIFTKSSMPNMTFAKNLVQFLFPHWVEKSQSWRISSLQGLQYSSPTDYWSRFLKEDLGSNQFRDQEILHDIKDWQKDSDNGHIRSTTLPLMLCDESVTTKEFLEKFEHFAPIILQTLDVLELAKAVFSLSLNSQRVKASFQTVMGFLPLWRIANETTYGQDVYIDWVEAEIRKALPISFQFAGDIYNYWSINRGPIIEQTLRLSYVKHVKEFFENKPDNFIMALNPAYMFSSHNVYLEFEKIRQGDEYSNTEWQWFFDLLLEAGELNPQVVVPQIARFTTTGSRRTSSTYRYNEYLVNKVFNGKLSRLMNIVSKKISIESFLPDEKDLIIFAQKVASDWLKKIDETNKIRI